MTELLERLWVEEDGVTMTETALILVLVSIVAIGALVVMGDNIAAIFGDIAGELELENGAE